jgi:hypothetical protein
MGEASSRMLRGTNSGSNKSGFSPSTSQRPTRTPPESGDGGREPGLAAADMRVLTDSDLAARHDVVLQDSGTIIMLEMPGRLGHYDAATPVRRMPMCVSFLTRHSSAVELRSS